MNLKRSALGLVAIAIALPALAQDESSLMIGTVDTPDRIASCALAVDAARLYATPIVMLAAPNTSYVPITFEFIDASGKQIGSGGLNIPPPLPTGLPLQLTQLTVPEGLASTRCSITGYRAPSGGNPSAGILGGFLAAGAAAVLISSNKKSTPAPNQTANANASPSPTPIESSAPTPIPTVAPTTSATATPTAVPTRTPTPGPSSSAAASPTPTPTATASGASPTPTPPPRKRGGR